MARGRLLVIRAPTTATNRCWIQLTGKRCCRPSARHSTPLPPAVWSKPCPRVKRFWTWPSRKASRPAARRLSCSNCWTSMAPRLCAAPLSKLWSATRPVLARSPSCCAVSRACDVWPWISATILRPNRSMFDRMTWRLTMSSPALKTTTPSNSLPAQLQQIGLRALPAQLDDFLARAAKARWSPYQVLEQLALAEITERSRRSLERRLRLSGIKQFKPMADFEWSWPTKIERDVIERALTLDFLPEGRNLVLVGQPILRHRAPPCYIRENKWQPSTPSWPTEPAFSHLGEHRQILFPGRQLDTRPTLHAGDFPKHLLRLNSLRRNLPGRTGNYLCCRYDLGFDQTSHYLMTYS